MRSAAWFLPLGCVAVSCQSSEVDSGPVPADYQGFVRSASAQKQHESESVIRCYFPENCYRIKGLDKPLTRHHPALLGKVYLSFVINPNLQISQVQVQATRLTWKKTGQACESKDSLAAAQLVAFLQPTLNRLKIEPSHRTDRTQCSTESWTLPVFLTE